MLPPVDDQVLRDNPEFANLYSNLTNVILNSDGSTRHNPAAKERASVREKLDKRRFQIAKHHLLSRVIATVPPPEPKRQTASLSAQSRQQRQNTAPAEASESLVDLLLVLPALLEPHTALSSESAALVLSSPPLSDLESLLPDLAALVSSDLHATAVGLTRITHPTTNPSYLHRHIASLSQDHVCLAEEISTAQRNLTATRLRILASLTELLHRYTASLVHLVRSLEAKHGVVARSFELRALDVSMQAQRTEIEVANVSHNLKKGFYTPQAVALIRAYAGQLRDGKIRLSERVRSVQAELDEYGIGESGNATKEKIMRDMAQAYREMSQQMADIEQDLRRLEKGQ